MLLLAAPGIAAAAPEAAAVSHVEPTDEGLQILVSVPADAEVDLDTVTVTIDGSDADSEAALAATTTTIRRTTVLTIDTSNSMRGERFDAAKTAAQTFLDTVPADVYVGVVTFDGEVSEPLDPTLDRDAAREVIDALALGPQTRLYDGVRAAVEMAGTEGQRSLLVLSDGADTSDTPLEDVTADVTDAEVLVDVVALEQTGPAKAALEELATAGSGQVIDADPDALRAAFTAEADVLARQILVTAQVPDSVSNDEATISVSLPTATDTLTAQAFAAVRVEGAPDPGVVIPSQSRDFIIPTSWMYGALGAIAVGLMAIMLMFVPAKSAPLTAEERAMTYTDRMVGRRRGIRHKVEGDQALSQAKDAAAALLRANSSIEAKVDARLEAAGSPFKPAEWLLLHSGIFIGAGVLGLLLGQGSLFLGVIFLAIGALLPWLWLGFKKKRRKKAFERSLPDTLQLISGSLAAGLSLAQSIDTVVREGQEPIASEFKRVLIETRLGVDLEDALEGAGQRFESKDFAWVVMAIKIQRQVGGNLAELLDTVAGTMREREYMRRQVSALAAEGKLSAWVLGGLPPGFLGYLMLANRDYVMPLFTEPMGWIMLIGAATLLSVGIFWMSRLIKVEV